MLSLEDIRREILEYKDEIKKLKDENKKYKLLKQNQNRPGTSRTSTFEHKKRIKDIFNVFNAELKRYNFNLDTIIIRNSSEDNDFNIKYITDATMNNKADVNKCLYFKDKIAIADHKYNSFKNGMELKTHLASLRAIKKRRKEIIENVEIHELSTGFYTNPVKLIKFRILRFLKNIGTENLLLNKKIRIKLSCDGTKISRMVTIINFVFTIVNEKKKAATASGNYRIGAFRILKEDYETLNGWLPVLVGQIKNLRTIKYYLSSQSILCANEIEELQASDDFCSEHLYDFEIEYLFSADWKMMAIVLGLYSAKSNFPCILCEKEKSEKNGTFHALDGIGTTR